MEEKMDRIMLEERSDLRGNYLVATGCGEGGYREEMLKNSRIPGLLTVTGQDFDGRHELWYETSGFQSLSVKFKKKAPGTVEITELLRQIEELTVKLEEYLLEPKEVGLTLSWIFEGEGEQYLFLYLPGYAKESRGGICGLLEELMEYVDYKNHKTVSFLYLLHAGSRQQAGGGFALHRLCGEILRAEQAEEEERGQDDFFAEFEETDEDKKVEKNGAEKKSRIRKIIRTKRDIREESERKERQNGRERGADGTNTDIWGKKFAVRKHSQDKEREIAKGRRTGKSKKGDSERWTEKAGKEGEEIEWIEKNRNKSKIKGLLNKFVGFIKGEEEDFVSEGSYGSESESLEKDDNQYGVKMQACVREQRIYNPETGECADTVLLNGEELTQTVLLGSDPETILLQEEQYCLKRLEEGWESIRLTGYPFCIGKGETCDYVLKEPVISRYHAKILKEEGRYFLVDTKSLNGTYLNGKRLAANVKAEIKKGDRIDFADLEFTFVSSNE